MTIITLLTDFGLRDGFDAMMRGVIAGICPSARVIDITHQIPPQDVRAAAFVLQRAAPYFPPQTVHVAVVDPGVGTSRGALAAQIGEHFFVMPDNGLVWPLLVRAREMGLSRQLVCLEETAYWRPSPSRTFHGRDVFAPVGAHLACGVPLEALGSALFEDEVEHLAWFAPRRRAAGWEAHIQYIDHFGNLFTDLPAEKISSASERVRIRISDIQLNGLVPSYGHAQSGDIVALINSENWLEIACVNGNAAEKLGLQVGDSLFVECL